MNLFKSIAILCLFASVNFSFLQLKKKTLSSTDKVALEKLSKEICHAYNSGDNVILVDKSGKTILNPTEKELLNVNSALFNQNRVRVTMDGKSDNDLCSTELVVKDDEGQILGNYAVNSCSAYGWIFFTFSDCFYVSLFHDAGLEAPYGNDINGSVDWTFQFNNESRVKGTYMDMGAANMFQVANPCYNTKEKQPFSATEAIKKMERRNLSLGL